MLWVVKVYKHYKKHLDYFAEGEFMKSCLILDQRFIVSSKAVLRNNHDALIPV